MSIDNDNNRVDKTVESDRVEIFSTEDEKIKQLGEFLSNDSSRKILQSLYNEELTANQISQKTGITLQLVKYHINKMQELGIVTVSKVEKNSKGHDMKFYSPTKFAVVILPSKVSDRAKESKLLRRSFKTIYKFVGIGVAAAAGLFSLSLIQDGQDPSQETPEEPPTHSGVEQFSEVEEETSESVPQSRPEAQPESQLGSAPELEPEPKSEAERSSQLDADIPQADPTAGTPFFDIGDIVLTIIIVGIVAGAVSAFFFWRSKKHSQKISKNV